MPGWSENRNLALIASAAAAALVSAAAMYRIRKAHKRAEAAEMAHQHEVALLKSELATLQAAFNHALRRDAEREQEIQTQQSLLTEERAALAEEREAIEAANDHQQAENNARRKALEEARASRGASVRAGAGTEARIESLQERLEELRDARIEREADEAVKIMAAQTPASVTEQSPAQAAREARRQQAAVDSERRRSKISLRRALSAKADAQLGLGASSRKHPRRSKEPLVAALPNDTGGTASLTPAAAPSGTVV
jgi:hypothetical protein